MHSTFTTTSSSPSISSNHFRKFDHGTGKQTTGVAKLFALFGLVVLAILFIVIEISVVYQSRLQQQRQHLQKNNDHADANGGVLDHSDLHHAHVSDHRNDDEELLRRKMPLQKLLDERQKLLEANVALKAKIKELVNSNEKVHHESAVEREISSRNDQDNEKPWLIIGIPTVPRQLTPSEPQRPVLLRTLDSLQNQLAKPTFVRDNKFLVKVVVLNQRPGSHPVFEQAKQEFISASTASSWIEFHNNDEPYSDPPFPVDKASQRETDVEFDNSNNKGHEAPTDRVKRQTLDVASMLKIVEGRSQYFLFYEDDFHFCDNALLHLMNMIERANIYYGLNSWSAIRCSFGLAGIVMQNGKEVGEQGKVGNRQGFSSLDAVHPDVATLRKYFLRHYDRRPPDHLAVEFYAKESSFSRNYFGTVRNVAAYRYNILRHDGVKSTLRDDEGWSMPGCFEELVAPQVFEVEAWDPKQCPNSDLWPCHVEQVEEHTWSKEDRRKGRGFRSFVRNGKIEARDS